MKKTRISYSAISTYTTCGEKYKLRYKEKLRSKYFHAALAFGSAADEGLNVLLKTKNLTEAKKAFEKTWTFQFVNKKYTSLSKFPDLVYAEADFDADLLKPEDIQILESEVMELGTLESWKIVFDQIKEEKATKGWPNLDVKKKAFYNYCNWLAMRQKGLIMLSSYAAKVLPRIKKVIAVQQENSLVNSEGDEVIQYLDLIVEWENGKNILFDNKTSARDYKDDQAAFSPQLISYYHSSKDQYKLDQVGFIVLSKHVRKNKTKACSKCSFDGTGGRHKTCNNEVNGDRCNGIWDETIDPEAHIDVIINDVTAAAEDLVLSTYDEANQGIKNEIYMKNLGACRQGPIQCEYFNKCWKGDMSELEKVEDKKDDKTRR